MSWVYTHCLLSYLQWKKLLEFSLFDLMPAAYLHVLVLFPLPLVQWACFTLLPFIVSLGKGEDSGVSETGAADVNCEDCQLWHPGSSPRSSSNSAEGKSKDCFAWVMPSSVYTTRLSWHIFLSGNPQTVRIRKQSMPHFPVWLGRTDLICSYVWPRLHLPHNHILFYYFGIMAAWTI